MSRKPLAAAAERLRGKHGRPRKDKARSPATPTVPARLLDVAGAAAYLSVSVWTVRDLIANGILSRVRVPLPNGGELRKVLLDREDLDCLIDHWKEKQAQGESI